MRAQVQESTAREEEEEHPYELLLTAETKKLPAVDGKTKGTDTHPPPPHPPAETTPKGFVQFVPRVGCGDAVPAAWAGGCDPSLVSTGVGVCLPPLRAQSKGRVRWARCGGRD